MVTGIKAERYLLAKTRPARAGTVYGSVWNLSRTAVHAVRTMLAPSAIDGKQPSCLTLQARFIHTYKAASSQALG